MPAPRGANDDAIWMLINSVSEQIKRISEQQEQLRTYLLTQMDEMRQTIIRREEYRDNLDVIKRDVLALSTKVDKVEESLTLKIENVGKESKAQQDANYRSVIRVQALILGTIFTTLIGVAIKLFIH